MLKGLGIFFFVVVMHQLACCQNLYVNNYTQKQYGSLDFSTSPQNWEIEQDSLGRLYIANSSGVILFDGLTWSMIPGTENYNLYELAKSSDGIIYAGGRNELGFFKSDSIGKLVFESLMPLLNSKEIVVGEIENVRTLGRSVYFQNDEGLIVFKDSSVNFYPIQTINDVSYIYNNQLVNQDLYGNLLSFNNQRFDTLYSFGHKLSSGFVSLIDISEKEKILFTEESGVFKIIDGELVPWSIIFEDSSISLQIEEVIHFQELKLYGLATKGRGILFINYDGQVVKSLGTNQGMTSNTCYSLFQDKNNELWACFDIGFARIEYPSSLSYFDYSNALTGVVYSAIEHQNLLYVGTTSGLYFLNDENQFHKMPIKSEVWDLKLIDGIIWAAATSGIYQINRKNVKLIAEIDARTMASAGKKGRLWLGAKDGLRIIENTNGSWVLGGKIKGVDHEIRTIAIDSDSIVWGSYEEISRVAFNSELAQVVEAKTLTEENGYSENFYISESYSLRNKIYFGTGLGIFSYDMEQKKLVPDPTFGDQFANSKREAWALAEDFDHNIWLSSDGGNGKVNFDNNQAISWDTLALARLKSTDVWRIVPTPNNRLVYFCTTDGLFRFDQNISKNYEIAYNTLINKIEINQDSIISYLAIDQSHKRGKNPLAFEYNDLRFSFTATSYNFDEKIQFRYFLNGYDKDWSSWKTESIKEYTNLPHGKYTFKVKAKNLYGIKAETAQYSFTILRPWYQTYWFYGIGLFVFAAGLFAADRIQRKRLFKKQQIRIKTQQQKLERERQISNKLRKVDKLKDEFLANTSHELRTPLNGIIGISESLYEESQKIDEAEMKNNLSMVIASGKRLASMVDSILDYSKLKTETLEIRKKPVDLKSIVKIVLTMSQPLIADDDIILLNEIPEDFPLLEADENRLQQILYNLVGNAIKFTEKGKVSVSAVVKDKFAQIEIRDEGEGIPADKLNKIFDSYEQVSSEINRDYIGTGLGLTITKKLVELHDGVISVESKLKQGSAFKFTIPISLQQSPSVIETPKVEIEPANLPQVIKPINKAQFNILIVDDEPINRQVLANHLKYEPYNLEMAANGKDALDLLDSKKIDLVLLDVMMPKISGFEVCMKIREKYMLSELPVIFITAKDQVIDLVEGLKYGGNDYITKPFSKQEFLARIKTHLNLFKINDSYARFIPIEFLQSLGRESIMEVNLGDQIEKEVTILFSDIREYTSLSEGMTPKENFEFLNVYLSKMGPIIRDNDGFIMQYLGDGLMCLFLNDPADAVKASIEMLGKIEEYNVSRQRKSRKPIRIGVGLHSGNLVLGVIGDEKRMNVNVVSDSVNTASRMEGLTKHYGASIIMSEHTLDGMTNKDEIEYRFLGMVKVKGKSNPLKIFEILDGTTNEVNKIKIETREAFEAGITHYFNKDFINAATEFKKVTTRNTPDVSAQMYLELSAKYMVETVPENWSGVETMLLK